LDKSKPSSPEPDEGEDPDDPGNRSDRSKPSSPELDEGVELGRGDEPDEPPKRSPRLPSPPRPPSRGSFLKAEEDPGNQSDRSRPPGPAGAVDEGVGLEDEPEEPPKRSPRSGLLSESPLERPPEPGAIRSPRLNWRDLRVGVGALREPAASARMSAVFIVAII
jgi:hypothetical protein